MKALMYLLPLWSFAATAQSFVDPAQQYQQREEERLAQYVGKTIWIHPGKCTSRELPNISEAPFGGKKFQSDLDYVIQVNSLKKEGNRLYFYVVTINDSITGYIDAVFADTYLNTVVFSKSPGIAIKSCATDLSETEMQDHIRTLRISQEEKIEKARLTSNASGPIVLGLKIGTPIDAIPLCDLEPTKTRTCAYPQSATTSFIELRPVRPKFVKTNTIAIINNGLIVSTQTKTTGASSQEEVLSELTSTLGRPSKKSFILKQNYMGGAFKSIEAEWILKDNTSVRFLGIDDRFDEGTITVVR